MLSTPKRSHAHRALAAAEPTLCQQAIRAGGQRTWGSGVGRQARFSKYRPYRVFRHDQRISIIFVVWLGARGQQESRQRRAEP